MYFVTDVSSEKSNMAFVMDRMKVPAIMGIQEKKTVLIKTLLYETNTEKSVLGKVKYISST